MPSTVGYNKYTKPTITRIAIKCRICVPCVYHYSIAAQTISVGRSWRRYGNRESCSTNSSQVTTDNRRGIGQQIPRLVRKPNSSLPISKQPTFRRHPEPDKPNPHTHILLKTFRLQSTLPNVLPPPPQMPCWFRSSMRALCPALLELDFGEDLVTIIATSQRLGTSVHQKRRTDLRHLTGTSKWSPGHKRRSDGSFSWNYVSWPCKGSSSNKNTRFPPVKKKHDFGFV